RSTMQLSTSGAWMPLSSCFTNAFFSLPLGSRLMASTTRPAASGLFLRAQMSKQHRKPSRFCFISSIIGAKRSLAPASGAVVALFITTPPSGGSLVISERISLQSATVSGAFFGPDGSAPEDVALVSPPTGGDVGASVPAGGGCGGGLPVQAAKHPAT